MKKNKVLAFIIVSILCHHIYAQNDTINQLDAKNKKSGWWIVFVDKDLARTYDTSEAAYAHYTWFDSDFDYFNIGRVGTRNQPVVAPAIKPNTNWSIPPLDGTFTTKHNNGAIRFEILANEGRMTYFKEYYKNGALKTHFDFTKSCGATPRHYCIYQYKKDGSLKSTGTLRTPN